MDAIVQNLFEINYSQLIQYKIFEKLVTSIILSKQRKVGGKIVPLIGLKYLNKNTSLVLVLS